MITAPIKYCRHFEQPACDDMIILPFSHLLLSNCVLEGEIFQTKFIYMLIYLNFRPLEVVSRYRDPQLQVVENYSYLFNLSMNISKS